MSIAADALAGFALSAGLIVAIGAQNAFVLRQGIRREHVAAVVLFCAASDFALMSLGVAGLGAGVGARGTLPAVLTACGAAFLLWYGYAAIRRALAPGKLLAAGGEAALSLRATLLRAAGFTFLNPHVYLDTVLLVGAVGAARGAAARVPFVAGAAGASLLWFVALGFGARLLAPLFARPLAWRVLDGAVAATMLALAAGLLRTALAWAG